MKNMFNILFKKKSLFKDKQLNSLVSRVLEFGNESTITARHPKVYNGSEAELNRATIGTRTFG